MTTDNDNSNGFEKFLDKDERYGRTRSEKTPSVICNGEIFQFSPTAGELYLKGYERVLYWIDEENMRVGFEPVNEGHVDFDRAYRISGPNNRRVHCTNVMKALGLANFSGEAKLELHDPQSTDFPFVDMSDLD